METTVVLPAGSRVCLIMRSDHRGYGFGQQLILFKCTRLRKSPADQATALLRCASVFEPQGRESKRIVEEKDRCSQDELAGPRNFLRDWIRCCKRQGRAHA